MAEQTDTTRTVRGASEAGRMAMALVLASFGMLFAASMAGYLVIRVRADAWPPPGMPSLPGTLWLSTVLLLASSGMMRWAVAGIRRSMQAQLRAGMAATLVLGVAFLVSQVVSWRTLLLVDVDAKTNLYGFTFYMLTGLHGLHVIAGLVLLAIVTRRAWRRRYDSTHHAGVVYSAMVWHFLDAVWLVMFAALVLFA